jgi:nucleoside-diphosphate-sugar epimerase
MRITLTGATGFVGKQILRHLLKLGYEVRALVRNHKSLAMELNSDLLEVIEIDDLFAMSPDNLDSVLTGSHTLIHAAWYTEPGKYINSVLNLHCLEGTIRLAQSFSRVKGKRFVGIGSCAEYDSSYGVLSTDTPLKPTNLYAACKVSAYQVLDYYFKGENIEFTWCRLFYLHGEGEDSRRLVPYIRKQLSSNEPALLSSGSQIRDFIDVVDASHLITNISLSGIQGCTNICTGVPRTVREMAEHIADEYGRRDLLHFGARPDNPYDPPMIIGKS